MSRESDAQRDRMAASLRRVPAAGADQGPAAGAALPPRTKPVRVTLDLAPDTHRRLKLWAVGEDASLVDVLRVLAGRLLEDAELAEQVRRDLRA